MLGHTSRTAVPFVRHVSPPLMQGLAFLTSTVAQHTSSGAFKLAASGFCNACSNGSRLNMPARPGLVPSSCPLTAGIVQQQLHQQQQHLVDLTGVQQSLLSPGLALRHTAVATAAAATAAAAAAAAAETVRVVQPRCLHTSQPVARTVRIPEAEAVENDNDNDDVYPGTEDEDEMEVSLQCNSGCLSRGMHGHQYALHRRLKQRSCLHLA